MPMLQLIAPLLIGIAAGLRTTVAPAAVSWAAYFGWIPLGESWLAFLGYAYTPWIFTIFVIGELIIDKLPSTPSRKTPIGFLARISSGALCGAALGIVGLGAVAGSVLGIAGAVIGTIGGFALRIRLATAFGRDTPAALLEDVVAITGALLIVALPWRIFAFGI
jgi:uncharacterized membrane protein